MYRIGSMLQASRPSPRAQRRAHGAQMPSQFLSDWIAAGGTRRLAGCRIFVRTSVVAGKAPLLLIHGYPTASYDWHRVWARLAARYSLYAWDMLGFGLSEKPPSSAYSIAQQADICGALLDDHGVAAAHVLAHDYGDTVAQELLAREREGGIRLQSVCFLNGGLFPETHRARPIQKLLAKPVIGPLLARTMTYAKFEATMLSISGRHPPSREELQDLWVLIERDGGRQALARLINYMEQRRRNRARWVGALVESSVPRRLVCGAADPVSGAHLAERYRQLVPDPDVVVLDGVGHYPQLEDPDRVVDAYLEFRARLDRAGRSMPPG
ncbi:MAG: alpha/beta hydrolase [Gammaproteobacteria bacterium]|nr:alpha/beta hydrolase [Gammaproteobacteria bacterium]